MPLFKSRKLSSSSVSTQVDPPIIPGGTTDGIGPLYPSTQRTVEKEQDEQVPTVFGDKSPGVRRIEIIGQFFTGWHKVALFFFIFLVSCQYTPNPVPGLS